MAFPNKAPTLKPIAAPAPAATIVVPMPPPAVLTSGLAGFGVSNGSLFKVEVLTVSLFSLEIAGVTEFIMGGLLIIISSLAWVTNGIDISGKTRKLSPLIFSAKTHFFIESVRT